MGEVGAVAILSVFALCCFRACRARRGCGFRGRRIRRNGTSKRGAGVCFAAESKAERLARCAEFRACFFVLCLGGAREKPPCQCQSFHRVYVVVVELARASFNQVFRVRSFERCILFGFVRSAFSRSPGAGRAPGEGKPETSKEWAGLERGGDDRRKGGRVARACSGFWWMGNVFLLSVRGTSRGP